MVAYLSVRLVLQALVIASVAALAGCGSLSSHASRNDRECLARAMYFESIRSSDEGMLAVGTVVMNRRESGKYPESVCGVVGQKNQFAPGVLSRDMPKGKSRDRAFRIADAILRGKRHRGVGDAMFFHTAGRTYRYENMHYVAVAGGNAFYERKPTGRSYIPRTMIAQAGPLDSIGANGYSKPVGVSPGGYLPRPAVVAEAEPEPRRRPRRVEAEASSVEIAENLPAATIEALILASNGY